MNSINKTIRIFLYQLKREGIQIRTIIFFIIMAIFIYSYLQPVKIFSQAVEIKVTPWALPHFVNDFTCQQAFMIGCVFLFCTAPFKNKYHLYMIYRSGKASWQGGIILYIVVMSFLYLCFINIMIVLSLLPHISFETEWGKIWGTLSRTNAGSKFLVPFSVYDYIIGAFTPLKAMLISFLLEWACFVWLGLVIYILNYNFQKSIGTLVASFFVFLDVMIYNSWMPSFYLISPVTLTQLKSLSGNNMQYGLTLNYAVLFFIISLSIFIVICLTMDKAKNYWRKK